MIKEFRKGPRDQRKAPINKRVEGEWKKGRGLVDRVEIIARTSPDVWVHRFCVEDSLPCSTARVSGCFYSPIDPTRVNFKFLYETNIGIIEV